MTASSMPLQSVLHFAKKYHIFTGNKHYFSCICKPVCTLQHKSCICLQSQHKGIFAIPYNSHEAKIMPGKHHLSAHSADGTAGKSSFLWLPFNDKQQLQY